MLGTHVPEAAETDVTLEWCSPGADCCTGRSKQSSLCGGKKYLGYMVYMKERLFSKP